MCLLLCALRRIPKNVMCYDITGNPYFHNDFYILFNLAVGGSFTGIYDIEGLTALKDGQTASMYIDWIKVTTTN